MSGTAPMMSRVCAFALLACIGVGATAVSATASVDASLDTYAVPSMRVDIGGGRRLNLRCSGNGAPTVILDIGLGLTSMDWHKVQPSIAKTTRVCSYDRAGFAFSDPGPMPRSARAEADDLRALVHAAHIPTPVVLVGHSLGSYIARIYANLHPAEVGAIVVVDLPAGDFDQFEPDMGRLFARLHRDDLDHGPSRRCGEAARAGGLSKPDPDFRMCFTEPGPTWSTRLAAAVRTNEQNPAYWDSLISEKATYGHETIDALRSTRRPYGAMPLVILGADGSNAYLPPELRTTADAAWTASYGRLAAYSDRGTFIRIDHSSHNVQEDRPDAIIAAVDDLVASLRGVTEQSH